MCYTHVNHGQALLGGFVMIIYIEDNLNNQRLLKRLLSKHDIQVDTYSTTREGFQAIVQDRPQLIFVDLHLKERHNGLDIVRWVRDAGIETPIVIVTVFNMIADRKRALEQGCNDYLSKPYSASELYQIVERWYQPAVAPT